MTSISMALTLREAGLQWEPALHDFFTIPDSGLEDKIFVLSNLSTYLGRLHHEPVITFHGTVEWALDYIWLEDVLWLPTEAQLREHIEKRLISDPKSQVILRNTIDGYLCEVQFQGKVMQFEAFGAAEAYGQALLSILKTDNMTKV